MQAEPYLWIYMVWFSVRKVYISIPANTPSCIGYGSVDPNDAWMPFIFCKKKGTEKKGNALVGVGLAPTLP
ncbi:hypothetical protein KDAU_54910 [Dictyobacter aurantiacus]|uniref:Uncharacterized protein n=1 Tax=Dictyobacter aurantiacus TaxID=1936993 RepID=A0A401ZMT0_9CHLR|nr:hypothetical protein KDAU_54910 [Dictyobacter aurantiacus]